VPEREGRSDAGSEDATSLPTVHHHDTAVNLNHGGMHRSAHARLDANRIPGHR
jgi:hypothetical protein